MLGKVHVPPEQIQARAEVGTVLLLSNRVDHFDQAVTVAFPALKTLAQVAPLSWTVLELPPGHYDVASGLPELDVIDWCATGQVEVKPGEITVVTAGTFMGVAGYAVWPAATVNRESLARRLSHLSYIRQLPDTAKPDWSKTADYWEECFATAAEKAAGAHELTSDLTESLGLSELGPKTPAVPATTDGSEVRSLTEITVPPPP